MAVESSLRTTARLRLEPIGPDHAEHVWRLHQDDSIAKWYGGTWDHARAHHYVAEMGRQWRRHGVGKWLAFLREDDELVGRGGLSWKVVAGRDSLEVGWALRRPYQGVGLATELGHAGLRFAAEVPGVTEVVAFTEVHNLASRAVMERLGMTYRGEIRMPGLVVGREGVHPDAPFALYAYSTAPDGTTLVSG